MADPGVMTLTGVMSRQTIVIDEGAVLELDGNFSSDRIRRLTFDRLRSVTSSVSILYGQIFVAVLLLMIAVFLFILALAISTREETNNSDPFVMVGFGIFILILTAVLIIHAMIYRRWEIRIESNVGPPIKVAGRATKRRVNAFLHLLAEQVQKYQANLR